MPSLVRSHTEVQVLLITERFNIADHAALKLHWMRCFVGEVFEEAKVYAAFDALARRGALVPTIVSGNLYQMPCSNSQALLNRARLYAKDERASTGHARAA